MTRSSFVIVLLLVALAGCATEATIPPTPTTTSPTAPPSPTGETAPAPSVLFDDSFDGSGAGEAAWSVGLWNATIRPDLRAAKLDGSVEETTGGVRMRSAHAQDTATLPYYGYTRPVHIQGDRVTLVSTVTPHTLYRWGLVMGGPDEWVHAQVDAGWFALAATRSDGWHIATLPDHPTPEESYQVRLTLVEDGSASAAFYDASGQLLGTLEASGVHLHPEEIEFVSFGVWVDGPSSPTSDYTTSSVRLTQS